MVSWALADESQHASIAHVTRYRSPACTECLQKTEVSCSISHLCVRSRLIDADPEGLPKVRVVLRLATPCRHVHFRQQSLSKP